MAEDEKVPVNLDDIEVELPAALQHLYEKIEMQRKRILKGKAEFGDPEKLRQFIALELMESMKTVLKFTGGGAAETYHLAASTATELARLRRWTAEHLRALGAQIENEDLGGSLDEELVHDLQLKVYALGSLIAERLPQDKAVQDAYNAVVAVTVRMVGQVDDEDDDDEDDEDEDDDESDDDDDTDDDEDEDEEDDDAEDGKTPGSGS